MDEGLAPVAVVRPVAGGVAEGGFVWGPSRGGRGGVVAVLHLLPIASWQGVSGSIAASPALVSLLPASWAAMSLLAMSLAATAGPTSPALPDPDWGA